MNFNSAPIVETSESIEPSDNNSELNAIGYTFFYNSESSLKCKCCGAKNNVFGNYVFFLGRLSFRKSRLTHKCGTPVIM